MNAPSNRFPAAVVVVVLAVQTACTTPNGTSAPRPRPSLRTASSPPASSLPSESPSPTPTPKRPKRHPRRACRYDFPVQPSDTARYGAYHHDYPATDIFAPEGSAFVAPTDGRVDWISKTDQWNASVDDPATRGGLSVAIVGDDGIRYYGSHLREIASSIKAGKAVRAGQKLGEVGNTGNAQGIAPHLHFGISHPTYPGDWETRRGEVSPYVYLNAWRAGDSVRPDVRGAKKPSCRPTS